MPLTSCSLSSHIQIEPGARADLHALHPFHYRSPHPGNATRFLRATYHGPGLKDNAPSPPMLAAVLVESLPALNCTLRSIALPGLFDFPNRSLAAASLNRHMRVISRVIVHPVFRSTGLAVALVKHALNSASTPYTEALAAMGRFHPFFEHAGMTRFDRPPSPDAVRLLAALDRQNLPATALVDLAPQNISPFLAHELRRYARTSDLPTALHRARTRLLSQAVYYLHRRT